MSQAEALQQFFSTSAYRMINVGHKPSTHRKALASGKILLNPEVLQRIEQRTLAKGDVIPLAEIAGINGAKSTATLLPLCHPLPLDHVAVHHVLNFEENCVESYCLVTAFAKTGVEMEAIAGVQASLLCIYDLCKMYGHEMVMTDIRLLYKEGGKSHTICYPEYLPQTLMALAQADPKTLVGITVSILTISDRASKGVYEDGSGSQLQTLLLEEGATVLKREVVADEVEKITHAITQMVEESPPHVIFTTGGTGVSPRDVTPEAIHSLIDYEIKGLGELLRNDGAQYTPFSWLSRSVGGIYHRTLIITLPGSQKAVQQGVNVLKPLIPHLLKTLQGGGHD